MLTQIKILFYFELLSKKGACQLQMIDRNASHSFSLRKSLLVTAVINLSILYLAMSYYLWLHYCFMYTLFTTSCTNNGHIKNQV